MVEKNEPEFIINKTHKKINKAGDAYEYDNLIVQATTKKEAEECLTQDGRKMMSELKSH